MQPQTFHITIKGKRVVATYTPGRAKSYGTGQNKRLFGTQHWEFRTAGAGPISETGYRSHFVNGTRQELGLRNTNIRRKTIKIAEALAAEYKGVTEHANRKTRAKVKRPRRQRVHTAGRRA